MTDVEYSRLELPDGCLWVGVDGELIAAGPESKSYLMIAQWAFQLGQQRSGSQRPLEAEPPRSTPDHVHVMRRAKGRLAWANGDPLVSGELWECRQPSCPLKEMRNLSVDDELRLAREALAAGVLKRR